MERVSGSDRNAVRIEFGILLLRSYIFLD